MKNVGIKELKNRTTQILKAVREEKQEFLITLNGEAVAALKPIATADLEMLRSARVEETLSERDAIARGIGALWKGEEDAAGAIANDRRA